MIDLLLLALLFLTGSGLAALLCNRHSNPRIPAWIGCAGAVAGSVTGLFTAVQMFFSAAAEPSAILYCGWRLHYDELAALFQLPVFLAGGAAAFHALGYMKGHDHGKSGIYWFFYNMTLAAMLLVTLVQTPLAFLLAWELMGIMSFALVAFEYRSGMTRQAAWIYLLACEAGALFLMAFFAGTATSLPSGILFILLIIGFGLKAGFPMLHVWLPEAHPAAPAPVSAVMSAAMINLGLFGILRFYTQVNLPAGFFGWTLLFCGLTGALAAAIAAAAQSNLKRLLAYSSIENIGIISIGLGLGFLGISANSPVMTAAGFGGAFLHLLNHTVLKGALFLMAGTIYKATGTLHIDTMGGLMKRLPRTGWMFTISGISISGIPPFNGFLGEFLIYAAAFYGITRTEGTPVFFASLLTMIVLALTGGVAAGAFVKAIGGVFLGEPRSKEAAEARPAPWVMDLPPMVFTILSFGLVFFAGTLVLHAVPVIAGTMWLPEQNIFSAMQELTVLLGHASFFSVIVCGFFVLLILLRNLLNRNREVTVRGTWDCGFAAPDARMEYTGTAFSQPLSDFLRHFTGWRKHVMPPCGFFPKEAALRVTTHDPAVHWFWSPIFRLYGKAAGRIRILQSGLLHLYILIMAAALVLMLCWGYYCPGDQEPPETVQTATPVKEVIR